MKNIIFHSLYTDLQSLKHALFYFGKISIPEESFLFALPDPVEGQVGLAVTGGNVSYADYITLIPEQVYPHLEFLEKEGRLERLQLRSESDANPEKLYELIVEEANRSARRRVYRPGDVAPLFSFLRLNPYHEAAPELIDQLAVMIVALCLRGVALGKGLPCVDNLFIFDLVNLGLKGIFESFVEVGGFSEEEAKALKAQYLGQAVISLFLPSFEFRSFDDVLELREHLKDGLAALESKLFSAGSELEGMPWESQFQDALAVKIENEIIPEINELRRQVQFSPKNIARGMATAGVVVALKSMLPDVVADWVVGGGAVSLWEAIKKERERTREVYLESSFSVLLQVPK